MQTERPADLKFEIGHVLFLDIVGYSRLLINQQSDQLETLKQIVRGTEQCRLAEAENKLLRLPTGDGGALVFRNNPEAPVLCALEISKALRTHPELPVRMGIHSGPVNEISDLNEQANIAGAGINIAQRVMDCGDAGHILLSRHVAEDLEHYPRWRPFLHELGECEVKHGQKISIVNLSGDDFGNPQLPEKFASRIDPPRTEGNASGSGISLKHWIIGLLSATAIIVAAVWAMKERRTAPPHIVAAPEEHVVTKAPEKSVAVLPFENLSDDKANAYFADGVQDEILTDLAKVADLKVISRTSVMQYRNAAARNLRAIGQELGVAHLLEGSVQRASGKVRINAQLIDARSDAHLWAQTYDRDLADVFAIQSEIATTIADQLRAKLSPKEEAVVQAKPTKDLAAYDLYLQATEIDRNLKSSIGSGGAEGARREVELLTEALKRDPAFVTALCRLADTHLYLHWLSDNSAPHVELAKKAIEAAARLDPDGAEVHLARALFYYRASLDYAPALAELALARRGLPNEAVIPFFEAMIERRQGKWDEAIHHCEQAVTQDPRAVRFISELVTTYSIVRRYDEAAKTLDNALAWSPLDFGMSFLRAYVDFHGRGDLTRWRALVSGEAAKKADPNDLASTRLLLALLDRNYHGIEEAMAAPPETEFDDNGFFVPREWMRAIAARGLGDKDKASVQFMAARERAAAAVKERPNDAKALMVLGQIDAALGRREDATREGEHSIELLPISKDALNGGNLLERLARIYAQTGDVNRALTSLESTIKNPMVASYGSLKLEEDWDALRHDPRFDKILATLAPKK